MLRTTIAVVALCYTLSVGAVDIQEDRFDGSTRIVGGAPASEGQPGLTMLAVIRRGKLSTLSLGIHSHSEEWKYLHCNTTKWLVNGRPYVLPQPKHDGSVSAYGVSEFMWSKLTFAQLKRLSIAESMEYKVCNDEANVDQEGLDNIQDFAIAIENALK